MKNSHKIGLLCCALTPTAFADEPASNPASDVINIIVPLKAERTPVSNKSSEGGDNKKKADFWKGIAEEADKSRPTESTRWNNAFSFKVKTGMISHSHNMRDVKNTTSAAIMDAKATSPYIGGGLGWTIGSISLVANAQRTDRRSIGALENQGVLGDSYKDNVFWREDYDVSASWRFDLNPNHSLSFFGGYKSSKTHYDTRTSKSQLPAVGVAVDSQKILFDSKGPFAGVGYAWRISEQNDTRLGLTVAYGKLSGASNQTITYAGGKPSEQPYNSEGTQGFRYGLFLTGPISRTKWGELNYTLGVDAYNYTIKQSLTSKLITGESITNEYSNKEKVLSVGGSIGYTFDL